jgi:hypothetical protein
MRCHSVGNTIDYARFRSRSHRAVIRAYDAADNVIETHEHAGDFNSGSVRQFTDYSGRFAVRICSVQAERSPTGFALPALSRLQ